MGSPWDLALFPIRPDTGCSRYVFCGEATLVLRTPAHALRVILLRSRVSQPDRCIRRNLRRGVACPVQYHALPASDCRNFLHRFLAIFHAGTGACPPARSAVDMAAFQWAVRVDTRDSRLDWNFERQEEPYLTPKQELRLMARFCRGLRPAIFCWPFQGLSPSSWPGARSPTL